MSSSDALNREPHFSDLVSRWMEEGDRLSASAATAEPASSLRPRARAHPVLEACRLLISVLARVRARLARHPAAVPLLGCALLALGATALHHYAREHANAPAAHAETSASSASSSELRSRLR